jgi:hypothetical protein
MKVFISWSGDRSQALAKALREWFPLVLHFIDPFVSQSDINAGDRWSVEIGQELANSNFGVICITRENVAAPWILFEAGALAKSMQEGRMIPLLLDLDFQEISGPLAQFQAKKCERDGIKDLIFSLNRVSSEPVDENRLARLFEMAWSDLEIKISDLPKEEKTGKQNRPQGDILEELVSSVRGVEMRVRDLTDEGPVDRKMRNKRINSMFMHEAMHLVSQGPRDPVQLLLFAGSFRDDLPWFYELALDAYRGIMSGNRKIGQIALNRFRNALELLQKSPIVAELGLDRVSHMMMRSELIEVLRYSEFEDFMLDIDNPEFNRMSKTRKNI